MGSGAVVAVVLVMIGIVGLGALAFFYMKGGSSGGGTYRSLMTGNTMSSSTMTRGGASGEGGLGARGKEFTAESLAQLKKQQRRKYKPVKYTLDQKFFMAGMFSPIEKRDFYRIRLFAPIICVPVSAFLLWYLMSGFEWVLIGVIMGLFIGLQIPNSILDRRIANRAEDIMYYLPLVIEQIAIGVSSSLDIGPCIQRVVSMADDRDTHNSVTELLKVAQNYVRTGVSLEEALTEIGKLSGHTELKHTFMSLSQVVRHGGEITKQLQELADAVSQQRETRIEGKIKSLELIATGPVGLVFIGFLIILLTGFGLQMKQAF